MASFHIDELGAVRETTRAGRDLRGVNRVSLARRIKVQSWRDLLRDSGRCINGPLEDRPGYRGVIHGPANEKSGKCDRCEQIARAGR